MKRLSTGNSTRTMQVDFFHLSVFKLLCCEEWYTFETSKVMLSTKCKCTCEVMKLGSVTHTYNNKKKKTQGPTMYTSATTVCSLCIVELQQRHSELVNGAISSNNMSYLTKALSHCHWMWFMSNKNALSEYLMLFVVFLEGGGVGSCIEVEQLLPSTRCQSVFICAQKKLLYDSQSVFISFSHIFTSLTKHVLEHIVIVEGIIKGFLE